MFSIIILPLYVQAVRDNNLVVVEQWLSYNKQHSTDFHCQQRDEHGLAPVHYAAKFNHLEIMEKLVDTGDAGLLVYNVDEDSRGQFLLCLCRCQCQD